jgi:uncharacterized protein (DUF2062 family)
MGWWRLIIYYRHRVIRLSSSAQSIAVNMAGGSAMSFTPFFGIHIFVAMGLAWLLGLRMNIIAATVGTFVGNPWTFPFLLYSSHYTGTHILDILGLKEESAVNITPDMMEEKGTNILGFIWENFTDIFVPTAIGGSLLAIISFPFYFILYYYIVRSAQRARKHRMKKRQKALFNKKSGLTQQKKVSK